MFALSISNVLMAMVGLVVVSVVSVGAVLLYMRHKKRKADAASKSTAPVAEHMVTDQARNPFTLEPLDACDCELCKSSTRVATTLPEMKTAIEPVEERRIEIASNESYKEIGSYDEIQ